jgi:hypothetical protein
LPHDVTEEKTVIQRIAWRVLLVVVLFSLAGIAVGADAEKLSADDLFVEFEWWLERTGPPVTAALATKNHEKKLQAWREAGDWRREPDGRPLDARPERRSVAILSKADAELLLAILRKQPRGWVVRSPDPYMAVARTGAEKHHFALGPPQECAALLTDLAEKSDQKVKDALQPLITAAARIRIKQ